MNKLILRLYIVTKKQYINVRFDRRLSFDENLKLLETISGFDFRDCQVVDPIIKKALRMDVPIGFFNLPIFRTLFIY